MLSWSVGSHVNEIWVCEFDGSCRIFRKVINLNEKENNTVKDAEKQTQLRVSTESQAVLQAQGKASDST